MWPDPEDGQNSNRQTPSWTDFEENRTKREQKAELTEPLVETHQREQNVMFPNSQEDTLQINKHPDR